MTHWRTTGGSLCGRAGPAVRRHPTCGNCLYLMAKYGYRPDRLAEPDWLGILKILERWRFDVAHARRQSERRTARRAPAGSWGSKR